MGLFGGFKAKFTKDSTTKSAKSGKKDVVVCLGYRVYSEFDNPPQYLHKSPEPSKQPRAIRTVAPRPNTATNNDEPNTLQPSTSTQIQTQIVTNPKIKKNSKKKPLGTEKHASTISASSTNIISEDVSSNSTILNRETSISNPNIVLTPTETVQLRNGGIKEESRSSPNSVYARGKTSSFNPRSNEISSSNGTDNGVEVVRVTPAKSILKSKSIYIEDVNSDVSNHGNNTVVKSNEHIYSDNEYDRTLTMASSKTTKSSGYTTKTADYMSASQAVTKHSSTEVATYVHTEVSSNKNDASSDIYNDNSSSYYSTGNTSYNNTSSSIGNTSNFAASIFFGGDEEPEVQRPRRVNPAMLQTEEERRSSVESSLKLLFPQ